MTESEWQFYLLLCMSGRTEESMAYKEQVESKEAGDSAGEKDQTV